MTLRLHFGANTTRRLRIHFVRGRLQAFWAIRRHRPLDSDSLRPEQSQVSGEGAAL